jgi:baculoviral IAP repeat-containing protein 7/8
MLEKTKIRECVVFKFIITYITSLFDMKGDDYLCPYFKNIENRKASYKENNLISINDAKNRLSQAGFFYIQSTNLVCCFSCGGCLADLSDYEDFWVEHAYWFPECEFIRKEKGIDFVKNADREKIKLLNKHDKKLRTLARENYHLIITEAKNKKIKKNDKNIVRRQNECVICYSREKKIIFIPCGHYVACEECSSKFINCPMCRKIISDYQRVYNA